MKKILILSLNYYPKFIGGAEVAIKEIVERQDKNKYEFHMLTLRFDSSLPKEEIIHGIKIHRIGFTKLNTSISDLQKFPLFLNKYYFQIFGIFYIWKLHRKEKYNAIWAMMAHAAGSPAGLFKIISPSTKYILTLQEGDPTEYIENKAKPFFPPISTVSYWVFKNAFKKADHLQTISSFLLGWGKKMGYKGSGVVIPNGVDVSKFAREISNEEISEVKRILGKKEGETWLITTSRLVHKNAVDDVISAIKLLPVNVHFAVLGIGPLEAELKQMAKDLKVEERVHFLGQVTHEKMPTYLKTCDIFIRPSRSEGMGNSFVEAFAAKLPVIATREGGLSDLIFDNETAFAVDPNSPESIKFQVEKILSDKENALRIVDNAFRMAKEKYSWDLVAKRMDMEIFSRI